jgi:hypothetical protein
MPEPSEASREEPGLLRRSPILSGLLALGLLGLLGHVTLGPSVVPPVVAGAGLPLAAGAGVGLWLASRRRR